MLTFYEHKKTSVSTKVKFSTRNKAHTRIKQKKRRRKWGMSANETTLHLSHNLKKSTIIGQSTTFYEQQAINDPQNDKYKTIQTGKSTV